MTYPETQQEIYDTVMNHLWKQGKIAYENSACRYRTEDGSKCAVGCLIPDNLYNNLFESSGVHGVIATLLDTPKFQISPYDELLDFFKRNEIFLSVIQRDLHDDFMNLGSPGPYREWLLRRGTRFAENFYLKPFVPSEV